MQPLSDSQMRALEEATTKYQKAVTRDAAKYLVGRGIDHDTAAMYRLGVVTDPLPGHTKYTGFLTIPYLDAKGSPLTMRFRCIQEHDHRSFGHGKYMSLSHDPARVFNIRAVHLAGNEIHVAEGEMDAIILNKIGLPAVAIPGATGWRPHHRRMLAGFSKVYVWGDPDDAGAEFITKVTQSLRTAQGVRLTAGDVSDTYKVGKAAALLDLINRKEAA